ncbi:caspase family protein, partial [Alphaproteobacteria bacterium]|nr:caspase family protein [Alphaproteobacteria bacterium]
LTQRRDDYKAIKEMFLYKQDTVKRKCEEFFKANLEVKKDKKYSKKTNSNSIKSSVALDEANKKASELERKLAALEQKQEQQLQQQSQPKIVVATKSKSEFPNKSINVNFKSIRKKRDDIAVIIGNANYKKQGKDIPNVNPAYADAEGIKQYFMKAKGIKEGNIIYLKDATNAQLLSVFGNEKSHKGKLFNYIKPKKSNVYIYYAGHGAPGEEGDAYLVPTDTDSQTIQFTGYQLSTLYSNLGKLPAKSVTIILEACFSGGSQSGSLISKASPINITPKKTMIPANVKVIAAGSERQMASWEQDSSHSLFTKYFLKAMSGEGDVNKDGKVSDAELKEYLSDTMTYYARRYYGRDQKVQIHNGG